MAALHEMDTDELLNSVAAGDAAARGPLLERHRQRLRRMIALRLDPQLRARVDPSDVVQESLAEANQRLSGYARRRSVPFYPWLRSLAWERLVNLHRRHIRAQRRSVRREQKDWSGLPDESAVELAKKLATGANSSPSARLHRKELRGMIQAALARLSADHREVLVLRYLEDLSTKEIAAILELSESAVKMRQLRALERLRELLGEDVGEELP